MGSFSFFWLEYCLCLGPLNGCVCVPSAFCNVLLAGIELQAAQCSFFTLPDLNGILRFLLLCQ